jgi:dihydrofolate reductase
MRSPVRGPSDVKNILRIVFKGFAIFKQRLRNACYFCIMVIVIAAIGSNRVIGTGNGLPWHIPSEYRQFLSYIKGQTMLMGRISYELFKNVSLPQRMVIVSKSLETDRVPVFLTFQEALSYARTFPEDVYICGGQSIYEESLKHADYLYLSFIKGEHQGNVYFPEFGEEDWIVEKKEERDEFDFVIYRRKTGLHEV